MGDSFHTRGVLEVGGTKFLIHRLDALGARAARLPFSLKVLLENLLRGEDGRRVTREHIEALLAWEPTRPSEREIPFMPARVLLQDFTGVPAVVDLAAMRDAMRAMGGEPARINPLQPADLVIDHSVQVDVFGTPDALRRNTEIEFERNRERYAFLRWGQQAFGNFRVVPPDTGIVHQVNLEYLAPVVFHRPENGLQIAYPDTVLGTDSHTTMINGLGVVGWGVGGIEAEAAMLGQPTVMLVPEVVGFRLAGRLAPGATATDVVLTVTEMLRKKGVVGKFVEFYGPGVAGLALADRATIGNMAPEYGATIGFFPIDAETIAYLRLSGRDPALIALVEAYARAQGLFRTADTPDPVFSDRLGLGVKPWVKTSLAPGSKVVTRYLTETKLMADLERLGFHLVGYGCTTCIGNSGPLPEAVAEAVTRGELVAAAVLSGNRNFEGRINPLVRANYLASPPLVVAYALAGTIDFDPEHDPLGTDPQGRPVSLRDLWPTREEIGAAMRTVEARLFREVYAKVTEGAEHWRAMPVPAGELYAWDPASTYIKSPPFFAGMSREPTPPGDVRGARVLALLGDSVTTDHISPAGSIAKDGTAGKYLIGLGVQPKDFNSYGARRGNHEVMLRGT